MDGDIAWSSLTTLNQQVQRQTAIPRLLAGLGLGFALTALLLAVLGIYVIAALEASQRNRELAIRQAVGAAPRRLVLAFLVDYGRGFAVAAVVGLAFALLLGRLLEARIFQVSAYDPWTLSGATVAFAAARVAGLLVPLRRIWTVQPGQLMRE